MEERKEKALKKRKKMVERERLEAAVHTELLLIYPLVPHKWEFWIEDNFEAEEKEFRKLLDSKKGEALEAAGGDKKKMN